jgi:hypothetical protein
LLYLSVANSAKSLTPGVSLSAAAVGTQAIIMAKCLALLCKAAVTGPHRWDEVETWFTYTLAAALLAIGTFWVRSLNKGLRMFPALIIVPIMQVRDALHRFGWEMSSPPRGSVG